MKIAKKLTSIISRAILFAALCISAIALATFLPINKKFNMLFVFTGSMEPALPVGSLIITKKMPDYQTNDIISFSKNAGQQAVSHRVVDKKTINGSLYYQTKGDANQIPDDYLVPENKIIGKYSFRLPLLGYYFQYTRNFYGLIFLVIVPSTIIVYEELRKLSREIIKISIKKPV